MSINIFVVFLCFIVDDIDDVRMLITILIISLVATVGSMSEILLAMSTIVKKVELESRINEIKEKLKIYDEAILIKKKNDRKL